mmetsp:Transcript_119963/g.339460  ORF Transcript_119963/g.339460 Transcript_119963/m.339460 type:complete len:205 (+) Transcript_119963:254-868(+)
MVALIILRTTFHTADRTPAPAHRPQGSRHQAIFHDLVAAVPLCDLLENASQEIAKLVRGQAFLQKLLKKVPAALATLRGRIRVQLLQDLDVHLVAKRLVFRPFEDGLVQFRGEGGRYGLVSHASLYVLEAHYCILLELFGQLRERSQNIFRRVRHHRRLRIFIGLHHVVLAAPLQRVHEISVVPEVLEDPLDRLALDGVPGLEE